MTARQFGRDSGDTYGRHALVNPGGDNVQRDVLHLVGGICDTGIHPSRLADGYVGAHRTDDVDVVGAWREMADIAAESNR